MNKPHIQELRELAPGETFLTQDGRAWCKTLGGWARPITPTGADNGELVRLDPTTRVQWFEDTPGPEDD